MIRPWLTRGRQLLAEFVAARSRRERGLLALLAAVLAALVLQPMVLATWQSLRSGPQALARLDADLQRMRTLQAQARVLREQPALAFDAQALQDSLAPLGPSARLYLARPSAELVLQEADPQALAVWLRDARRQAGAVVSQAQLQRSPPGEPARWSGTLRLDLPP